MKCQYEHLESEITELHRILVNRNCTNSSHSVYLLTLLNSNQKCTNSLYFPFLKFFDLKLLLAVICKLFFLHSCNPYFSGFSMLLDHSITVSQMWVLSPLIRQLMFQFSYTVLNKFLLERAGRSISFQQPEVFQALLPSLPLRCYMYSLPHCTYVC